MWWRKNDYLVTVGTEMAEHLQGDGDDTIDFGQKRFGK
jgi:hypothetical protein